MDAGEEIDPDDKFPNDTSGFLRYRQRRVA